MRIGNASASKYHNHKTKGFDSAKEWRRNQELETLQRAGEISELNRQVPFVLMPSYTIADETTKQGFRTVREIRYIADFTYRLKDGTRIIEDVKGIQTEVFKIKRKLLERKIALGVIEGEFRIY
nr:MAG TPA: Endonuclease [Caudoviricetes sp.]